MVAKVYLNAHCQVLGLLSGEMGAGTVLSAVALNKINRKDGEKAERLFVVTSTAVVVLTPKYQVGDDRGLFFLFLCESVALL